MELRLDKISDVSISIMKFNNPLFSSREWWAAEIEEMSEISPYTLNFTTSSI
jgi:hypothetical protein